MYFLLVKNFFGHNGGSRTPRTPLATPLFLMSLDRGDADSFIQNILHSLKKMNASLLNAWEVDEGREHP
jgi:hypothetical protein